MICAPGRAHFQGVKISRLYDSHTHFLATGEFAKVQHILAACQIFNNAGFTHIRDMSCTESLWDLLIQTSESSELTLAIEENYTI